MSKNFENEYIALTQVEVPDLWDRIEAGLNPKSTQDSEKVEASVIDFEKEMDSRKETEDNDRAEKSLVYFVKKYKTVLAAAVCVIVILPAAVMIGRIGMGGSKSESAADAAPAEMEYAVVTEAAAEEPAAMEEAAIEETAAEEVMEEAEMAADEAVEAPEAYEMYEEAADGAQMSAEAAKDASDEHGKEMAEETAGTEMKEAVNSAAGVSAEAAEEERAVVVDKLYAEDGAVLTHVTIRILAKEEVASDGESKGLGNLYRAKVLNDADGLLAEGDEILVYISPLSSLYLPDKEETYDVMLEYDSTREYPFWLKSCY